MKVAAIQPDVARDALASGGLRARLRTLGIALLHCSTDGEIVAPGPSSLGSGQDWLTSLLVSSPLFLAQLRMAANQWAAKDPATVEVIPGLWLTPMSISARRRRAGFAVAVIVSEAFLRCEQFLSMCQSAQTDAEMTRRLLGQLPPVPSTEINRLAALVRQAHEDHIQLTSEGQDKESVGRQLAESYEEINLLYTIIQNMTMQQRPERFVALACQELLATLPFAWIGTQLADDRERLKSLSGRLIIAGSPGRPAQELRAAAQSLMVQAQVGVPMVFAADGARHQAAGVNDFGKVPEVFAGSTVVIQPVSSNGQVVGLLIAGEKKGPDTAASSADMKLLGATATHMAIFLENAALYDDLNAMFLGTLEALTASIDAKDRYTCGHSRRVAHLTAELGKAIGLDEYAIGRMHIAGMVHDVGKIGVPEAVLLKPGKLTAEEFGWIRKHPEMGYRILRDIPQLNDILPGVLYHHERWDGRGYPEGLSGNAIPLVARLIALADSFDAMSSTRTYRSSLSRPQVLDEIARCSGAQFDPELAEAFMGLDFSMFDRMVHEHQIREREELRREEAA